MKNNWQDIKLGDIATISRGGSPRPIESFITEEKNSLNWLRIGDIDLGAKYICSTSEKIKREGLSKTTLVHVGDFILSNSMSFGRPYIMKIESCIHDGWLALKDINIDLISKEFLYYLLSSNNIQNIFVSISAGSGVQNLKKESVSNVVVSLPLVDEQKRIVSVLEVWDSVIEKLTQKIKIKKNIKKSLMQKLLTGKVRLPGFSERWQNIKLGQVGEIVTGNTPPMKNAENYGNEFCWATAEDFNSKYIKDTNIKLSEAGKLRSRFLPVGSILVTCIASLGKNAIAWVPLATNQQINSIIVNPENNNEFIYYIIENSSKLLRKTAGAGAMPILNKSSFANIKIKIPNLKEQDAIADILTKSDAEIGLLQEKLTKLKDQKKYLLNNLITGKIRTPEKMIIN